MAQIDYPAHLEKMWQKAIAPRSDDAPTVISTFAGAGGSLTGYMMAGYRDLLAVEWDNNAVETLRLNWPELDIYHGDIAKLTVDEVLQRTGLQPGELDVLDGSPPCQGFSTAGKRILNDSRNQLFREYVRLLRGLRPKVFVMENVSGMVKGKMKLLFVEILKELKASGYQVSARLLNAMYFHVPQSRQRMIFIGVRNDLKVEPSHPKAESDPMTVGEAWGDKKHEKGKLLSGPAAIVAPYVMPGDNNGGGKYSLKIRGTTAGFGLSKLSYSKPSCTIPKMYMPGSAAIVHPEYNAMISRLQVQRVSSFPDAYKFIGDDKAQWERVGNSVPPLFMEAIARHIRRTVLDVL